MARAAPHPGRILAVMLASMIVERILRDMLVALEDILVLEMNIHVRMGLSTAELQSHRLMTHAYDDGNIELGRLLHLVGEDIETRSVTADSPEFYR